MYLQKGQKVDYLASAKFEFSERPLHDREVSIDQSIVVFSSNGDVYCKYNGFIN